MHQSLATVQVQCKDVSKRKQSATTERQFNISDKKTVTLCMSDLILFGFAYSIKMKTNWDGSVERQ